MHIVCVCVCEYNKKQYEYLVSYSIKKSTQTITKGYLHNSGIRIRILINYNFWGRNIFRVAVASILTPPKESIKPEIQLS